MAQGRRYVPYGRQQAARKEGEEGAEGGEGEQEAGRAAEDSAPREFLHPRNSVRGSFGSTNQPRPPRNTGNGSLNSPGQPRPPKTPMNNSFSSPSQPRPPMNGSLNRPSQPRPPMNPVNGSFQPRPAMNPMNGSFNHPNQPRPARTPRPQLTSLNTLFQPPISAQQHSLELSKPAISNSSLARPNSAMQATSPPNIENTTPKQHKPTPLLHRQFRNTEHTPLNSSFSFQAPSSSSNPISLFTTSPAKKAAKGNSLLGLAAGLQQRFFEKSKFAVCLKQGLYSWILTNFHISHQGFF